MDLDFLSILVAAVIALVFAVLYYSKYMVGDIWMKEVGISHADIAKIKENLPMTLGTVFVLNLCTAAVMDFLFSLLGVITLIEAFFYSILFWVAFFGVTTLANNLLEGRSFRLFILKMVYQFLSFLLMGIVLVLI